MLNGLKWYAGLLLLLGAAAPAAGAGELRDLRLALDAERVRWTYMRMQARKFLFTATTTAQLDFVDAAGLDDVLIPVERGKPVMPGELVARLSSVTRFFGKESKLRLHMSPDSARAIQYALDEDGDRLKHRIYRYTDTGIFVRTHRPATRDQRDESWQTWTELSTEWRTISEKAYGAPIVEPLGLLYVAGAVDLEPGGPPIELLSISDRKVTRVRLTALEAGPRDVDYVISGPAGRVRCEGEAPALRIAVDGEPVEPTGEAGFQFLGLEENIRIHIEPQTRVVLEVSGRAPIVGHLVIRLQDTMLNVPGGCPAT